MTTVRSAHPTGLRRSLAVVATLLLLVAGRARAMAAEDAAGAEFFEKNIRPILAENCFSCHSALKGKHKGGLEMDSKPALAKGGDSGVVIKPGEPDKSPLITAVRYVDKDMEMPPDGKLKNEQIKLLEQWVKMGAPDPRSATVVASGPAKLVSPPLEKGREFWSFKPMTHPTPPAVKAQAWVKSPLDRFVLARLEAAGMQPAPEIDKRGFIRRATFDLLGLPPTPQEVDAFLADASPKAYDTLVDRLLAAPQYGERWGRYWLDLVRYSDSNGLDENLAYGHAWLYRDYVVRAFNADKPYDRFLTEQLAGDLLPPAKDNQQLVDQITATGFQVLGPKMLAEHDNEKLVMDVVDEQIDVMGKAMLGLTLGCARCHDHKFDPVPTKDYYALAGIVKSTAILGNQGGLAKWNEHDVASVEQIRAAETWKSDAKKRQEALDATSAAAQREVVEALRARTADYLLAAGAVTHDGIAVEAEAFARGNLRIDSSTYGSADTTIVHTAAGGQQFAEYDLTVPSAGRYLLEMRYAAGEERGMRVLVGGTVAITDAFKPTTGGFSAKEQAWRDIGEITLPAGKAVLRFERDGAIPHLDKFVLHALGANGAPPTTPGGLDAGVLRSWSTFLGRGHSDRFLAVWNAYAKVPADAFAAKSAEIADKLEKSPESAVSPLALELLKPAPPASRAELAERYQAWIAGLEVLTSVDLAVEAKDANNAKKAKRKKSKQDKDAKEGANEKEAKELSALQHVLFAAGGPLFLDGAALEARFPDAVKKQLTDERAALAEMEKSKPAPFDRAMSVNDQNIVDVPVHIRGSTQNLAATKEPRGFLHVTDNLVKPLAIPEKSSGRLELAQWMTSAEHPLTARVMANRIWLGHFAEGLVRTPSNFGLRGELPTHPELLDWLARNFQEHGWSIKALHREIMRSSAYRMASAYREDYATKDPENRLLWRQNRHRLEAEPIRDSILVAAGRLDLTIGGSLLDTKNGDYVTNDQSNNKARYSELRRALYMPIIRNAMYDLFTAFDYSDPSVPIEKRPSSTIPHQALWLINSPFAVEQSGAFAERVAKLHPDDERAQVAEAYRIAYGRPAAPTELDRALKYLASVRALSTAPPAVGGTMGFKPTVASTLRPLQSLCQILIASNEFLYID
ncbi:MAG: DUF1553 domain-containing protein [Planctomycetes bacterium]|nr:DUF1553 domain-containing protein [Planctomycetota bacterium]